MVAFSLISTQVSQNTLHRINWQEDPCWHLNREHIPESDLSTLPRSQEQMEPILKDNCVYLQAREQVS